MMFFSKKIIDGFENGNWINPIQNSLMGIMALNITGFIDKTING